MNHQDNVIAEILRVSAKYIQAIRYNFSLLIDYKLTSKEVTCTWIATSSICLAALILLNNYSLPDYNAYGAIITEDMPRSQPLLMTGNWAWSGMYLSRLMWDKLSMTYSSIRIFWIMVATGTYFGAFLMLQKNFRQIKVYGWTSAALGATGVITLLYLVEYYLVRLRAGICLIFLMYQCIFLIKNLNPEKIRPRQTAVLPSAIAGILAITTHTATYLGTISYIIIPVVICTFRQKFKPKVLLSIQGLYWFSLIIILNNSAGFRGNQLSSDLDWRRIFIICVVPLAIYLATLALRRTGSLHIRHIIPLQYMECYAMLSGIIILLGLTGNFDSSGEAITRFLSLSAFSCLLIIYRYGFIAGTLPFVYLASANGLLFLKDLMQ